MNRLTIDDDSKTPWELKILGKFLILDVPYKKYKYRIDTTYTN